MESTVDLVHAAQWGALRAWADTLTADQLQTPSNLAGWTVEDLLAHLALSVDAIASLRPPSQGDDDLGDQASINDKAGNDKASNDGAANDNAINVAEYLAAMADRAESIARSAQTAAAGSATNRGGNMDAAFTQARRTLLALHGSDPVVITPGGQMRLSDFLLTRLIELVVHARDLIRALPDTRPPLLLDAAIEMTESALRQAFRDRAGVVGDDTDLARLAPLEFIDVASGRLEAPTVLASVVRSHLPLI